MGCPLRLPFVPPHVRVTSSGLKHGPLGVVSLFWHDDFAVGNFLFFFFSFFLSSSSSCNSQNWFGLILNGFQSSLLCPEKTCLCFVSPPSESGAVRQDGSRLQRPPGLQLARRKPPPPLPVPPRIVERNGGSVVIVTVCRSGPL